MLLTRAYICVCMSVALSICLYVHIVISTSLRILNNSVYKEENICTGIYKQNDI